MLFQKVVMMKIEFFEQIEMNYIQSGLPRPFRILDNESLQYMEDHMFSVFLFYCFIILLLF